MTDKSSGNGYVKPMDKDEARRMVYRLKAGTVIKYMSSSKPEKQEIERGLFVGINRKTFNTIDESGREWRVPFALFVEVDGLWSEFLDV
jgi:hypothetical protein